MSSEEIVKVSGSDLLRPAAGIDDILAVYQAKKDFIERVLKKDLDYGTVPGSSKNTLLKPGAEKLASLFGLATSFEDVETIEDWSGAEHGSPLFYYRQKCKLYKGDKFVGSADGSCSSWEAKYRYRKANLTCPECGKETVIKGKEEYGGGWLCWTKKNGCGAKFADGDPAIIGQNLEQVEVEPFDFANTILKMAQKRAFVAAILITTGASDYFTQDMEDFVGLDGKVVMGHVTDVTPETKADPDSLLEDIQLYHPLSKEVVDFVAKLKKIKQADAAKLIGTLKIKGNVTLDDVESIILAHDMGQDDEATEMENNDQGK